MSTLKPRDEIGPYEILRTLPSKGGFGKLYQVRNGRDQVFAAKELFPSDLVEREADGSVNPTDPDAKKEFELQLKAFESEAKHLRIFRHRNIVRVYDYVKVNKTAYIVMEWIDGKNLAQLVGSKKHDQGLTPFTLEQTRELLLIILHALEDMHEQDPIILHRDIKPQNIMIRTSDGEPVLVDFGAARQLHAEKSQNLTTIVSRGFAPYEQYVLTEEEMEVELGVDTHVGVAALPQQGPPTDIYALGAVCYYILTGIVPPASIMRKWGGRPLKPLAERIPGDATGLVASIDRALAIEPKDRFQTARAWRNLLEPRGPPPPLPPPPPPVKRYMPVIVGTLILAAAIMILAYASTARSPVISIDPAADAAADAGKAAAAVAADAAKAVADDAAAHMPPNLQASDPSHSPVAPQLTSTKESQQMSTQKCATVLVPGRASDQLHRELWNINPGVSISLSRIADAQHAAEELLQPGCSANHPGGRISDAHVAVGKCIQDSCIISGSASCDYTTTNTETVKKKVCYILDRNRLKKPLFAWYPSDVKK